MTTQGSARLHYLDAMRSVLMLLGLVLHAARPYDTGSWRVKDVQQWPLLDGLVSTLHLFRMPAFFVVAGFFAMYLVRRRPTGVFLRERLRRVLVPLAVVLLTVNVLQAWFVARFVQGDTTGLLTGVLLPQFWSGSLVSHLWFLVCLALYFSATALAAPLLRRMAEWQPALSSRGWALMLAVVIAIAMTMPVAAAVLGKLLAPTLHQHWFGLIHPMTVLEYLPFFAVGIVLCAYPPLLERFSRVTWPAVALAAVGGAGLYLLNGRDGAAWKAIALVSGSLLAWMAIRAVFAVFRRVADRPSKTFRYLSDASYSIYLFHHVIVIVAATWLLPTAIGAGAKFLIVLAVAASVSLAIYHVLIRRSALLSYLFNGAIRPAIRPGDATEAASDDAAISVPARHECGKARASA
jgi:glucan biosynthesis protein C